MAQVIRIIGLVRWDRHFWTELTMYLVPRITVGKEGRGAKHALNFSS